MLVGHCWYRSSTFWPQHTARSAPTNQPTRVFASILSGFLFSVLSFAYSVGMVSENGLAVDRDVEHRAVSRISSAIAIHAGLHGSRNKVTTRVVKVSISWDVLRPFCWTTARRCYEPYRGEKDADCRLYGWERGTTEL